MVFQLHPKNLYKTVIVSYKPRNKSKSYSSGLVLALARAFASEINCSICKLFEGLCWIDLRGYDGAIFARNLNICQQGQFSAKLVHRHNIKELIQGRTTCVDGAGTSMSSSITSGVS